MFVMESGFQLHQILLFGSDYSQMRIIFSKRL